jgi:hypothetical protein
MTRFWFIALTLHNGTPVSINPNNVTFVRKAIHLLDPPQAQTHVEFGGGCGIAVMESYEAVVTWMEDIHAAL